MNGEIMVDIKLVWLVYINMGITSARTFPIQIPERIIRS
jgi:hypothetical protein